MLNKNPFLIYGYMGPEYFCDREEETKALISALTNGRNVTLMSPRRMGKTGLIRNAFHHLNNTNPEVKCFYMDIFATNSLKEFTQLMGKTILGQLDCGSEKWINRITDFFKSFRPLISSDPITGAPTVILDIRPNEAEASLKEIFSYIAHNNIDCIIAIDEFQQISEYPEMGTEALLRSFIQFIPNVHFIFSGSKRHIMNEMFSSPKRPFYQSTQKMNIDEIGEKKYYEFASTNLRHKGIELSEDTFNYIYATLHGHTWYIQRILNKVYEVGEGLQTVDDVKIILQSILNEEEYNFQMQYNSLTLNQQNLLRAVAQEKTVRSINGKEFMQTHQLMGTSSINRALENLTDKELIINTPEGYQVYDRFMGLWLRQKIQSL